jgi:tetratricopeptide (TPR) repeat protein
LGEPDFGEPDFGEPETLGAAADVPPPLESDLTNSALDALNAAARPAGRATSGFPSAPRTSRVSATRGPSGSRVFLVVSAAVLVTAAIAFGAIALFGKRLPTAPPGGANVRTGDPKEMEALRTRLSQAEDKLAAEQERARIASKARQDLELKLEEAKLEADGLKGRLEQLSSSLGYVLEAQALLERHSDLEGALSLVDAALKRDPGMIEAWRLKGKILAASGLEARPALEAFERADKAARDAGGPGDAEGLVLAGEVCLTDLGDRERALGYFKRAAELATESSFRLAADARASQLQNRADRAVAKANELAKAEPSLALAPLIAGEVIFDQALAEKATSKRGALLEKADIYLAKSLKLDPNSARGCLMRGRLLLEQSKLASGFGFVRFGPQSRAERLLSTAKQLKPRIPDVHLALAELSLSSGALRSPAQALQSATTAVRLTARKNAPALALLAQAHAANGDPGKAVIAMQEAMTIEPKRKEYIDLLRRYKEETQSLSQ